MEAEFHNIPLLFNNSPIKAPIQESITCGKANRERLQVPANCLVISSGVANYFRGVGCIPRLRGNPARRIL